MTSPTVRSAVSPASVHELRTNLGGPLIEPQDAEYDAARSGWNAMADKRPALIAQVLDVADVRNAIRFARREGLELGVTCGRHSALGQGIPDGGLHIDLRRMNAVRVDPEARLAYVGGGAMLGDLDRATEAHGLATTAGNVSHTGVGGLTLGGGEGWLARQFGLACDNVVSFEIVTADGQVLTASDTENPDLAWGLRGGGGNFGVVTQFTFRLHPIVHRALSVDFFYDESAGPEVVRALRELALDAPDKATYAAWVGTAGEWPSLPKELHGTRLANLALVWVGDPSEGRVLIPAMRAVGRPLAEAIDETSYVELQTSGDEPNRHGLRRYTKDHYLGELSDAAIEAFVSCGGPFAEGELRPNGLLLACGGAVARVGVDETAFSHRKAMYEFLTSATWEDPADDEMRMAASRRFAAALEPFAVGTYVNTISDDTHPLSRAYAPATLERLTSLKDRYDPDNVFHSNHNIPPSGH
jgi:FAD/FMN-containing dehydrogenase